MQTLEKAVFHLTRSNNELRAALEETPGDADFRDAISENVDVIAKKLARLQLCKEEYTALLRTANPSERALPAAAVATTLTTAHSSGTTTASDGGGEAKQDQQTPGAATAGVLL